MILNKKDILTIPFQDLNAFDTNDELNDFVKSTKALKVNSSWILPQILAYYGSWKLIRGENGLIDPKVTSKENITSEWALGLWKFVTKVNPSNYLSKQNSGEYSKFGCLTPLILAGSKFSKNISYKEWDISSDSKLISERLLDAMFWHLRVSEEETLAYRAAAVRDRNPVSVWNPLSHGGTNFTTAPALARVMYTQCWLAHPSIRHELMVLDPLDWDRMPKPLVSDDIFIRQKPVKKVSDSIGLPW